MSDLDVQTYEGVPIQRLEPAPDRLKRQYIASRDKGGTGRSTSRRGKWTHGDAERWREEGVKAMEKERRKDQRKKGKRR